MHQVATSLEGIFDDPKLVADVKEAVATIKKVRLNFFGIQHQQPQVFPQKMDSSDSLGMKKSVEAEPRGHGSDWRTLCQQLGCF